MPHKSKTSVSVVVPALNEEAAIKDTVLSVLASFKEYGIDGEIVVVNDGSKDKTRDIVEELIKSHPGQLRLLDHKYSCGMGRSFWDGASVSGKDAVTLIPGDNENDPSEILRYLGLLEHVDVVVPFVYNKEVRSPSRNVVSSLFSYIINSTFGTSFNYTNGTALYRREVLLDVRCRSNGFFFLAETLIKLVKKGYLFAEVPYALSLRCAGQSKAISMKSLRNVIKDYFHLVQDVCFSREYRGGSPRVINSQTHIRSEAK